MKKAWTRYTGIALVALFAVAITTDVFGRGFSSGGSRSFSSGRSSSWGGSSRSSGSSRSTSSWGSGKSTSSWGSRGTKASKAPSKSDVAAASAARKARLAKSSTPKAVTPPTNTSTKTVAPPVKKSSSNTSSALAKSSKVKGKTTQTLAVKKQEAAKASLAKMKSDPKIASQYTSKYSTQPATRPSHIPQTYSAGGNTYNVTYNSGYGGYGYMGPSGAWIMYDALSDVAMYSMLSHRHPTYAYNEAAVERSYQKEADALIAAGRADEAADLMAARRARRSRAPFIFLGFMVAFVLIGVIIVVSTSR